MKNKNKKIINPWLYWSPRILTILFILFISLFALDIFDMSLGFWETVLGLFIHLIPSFVLIIFLIIAWKHEWIGAIGFFLFLLWYVFMMRNNFQFPFIPYLIIPLPALIVGILWWMNWVKKQK